MRRNFHGTKQACRIFTDGVDRHLRLWHFERAASDSCTFILRQPGINAFFIFVITIDDFLAISNKKELIQLSKKQLSMKYKIQDLGPVGNIVQWKAECNRHAGTITISQPAYTTKTLREYGADSGRPAPTPYITKKSI